MKLYTHPISPNARKVHGVATHAGIALEREIVDIMKGAQREPAYLAINPNGLVPALVDGDTTLWESNTIAAYVAGRAESDLWPRSDQRYDIMRWCDWEANHWSKAIGKVIGQKFFNADNPNQALIDEGIASFRKYAGVLDGHLAGGGYMSGGAPTVADFCAGVWLGYTKVLGLPLDEFAHLTAWHERLNALPAWAEMLPPKR